MYNRRYKILFLCQDNASYSPVAEALMCRWSDGQFITSSAGIIPSVTMHPFVTRFLDERSLPDLGHLPRALQSERTYGFDYVFLLDERVEIGTLPGSGNSGVVMLDWRLPAFRPESASWPVNRAYYATLEHRIRLLCCTQFNSLDDTLLYSRLNEIAALNDTLSYSRRGSDDRVEYAGLMP